MREGSASRHPSALAKHIVTGFEAKEVLGLAEMSHHDAPDVQTTEDLKRDTKRGDLKFEHEDDIKTCHGSWTTDSEDSDLSTS